MGCQVLHAAAGQHLEGLPDDGQVVFRQGARVGPGVGQRLVAFIQALCDGQGGLGAVAEFAVGLALQRGQIEQQGAGLRRGFAFLGDRGGLAAHGVGDGLGFCDRPDPVGPQFGIGFFEIAGSLVGRGLLPLRVEPLAGVLAGCGGKAGMHFPIVAAHELADFLLALDDHRQRGGLHPAHGGEEEAAIARVEGRHGPGTVDAHQPVGLGAAARSVGQRQHLLVAAQRPEAVADGLGRHRLQPQALHRVLDLAVLLDQPEDQFTLAARVAGIDEGADVLALGQPYDGVEARLGLVQRLELEVRRNDRQVRKTPLAALHVEFFGGLDLHQVADGAGHHVLVVLEMVFHLLELARAGRERAHDVLGHRGLLGDHQCLG